MYPIPLQDTDLNSLVEPRCIGVLRGFFSGSSWASSVVDEEFVIYQWIRDPLRGSRSENVQGCMPCRYETSEGQAW